MEKKKSRAQNDSTRDTKENNCQDTQVNKKCDKPKDPPPAMIEEVENGEQTMHRRLEPSHEINACLLSTIDIKH